MHKRQRARVPRQLELTFRTRGGARKGAGRKPSGTKAHVPHVRRPEFNGRHPLHVTMRLRQGLPSLRQRTLAALVFGAFRAAKQRLGARLVQFSIQSNHLHLILEADGRCALSRAMQGLAVRVARRLNATVNRRGSVFADRFHARALRTPLEVRRALLYILQNHRHHGADRGAGLDPFSSAPYFDGFARRKPVRLSPDAPVTGASTWLMRVGWQRHGLLREDESPAV